MRGRLDSPARTSASSAARRSSGWRWTSITGARTVRVSGLGTGEGLPVGVGRETNGCEGRPDAQASVASRRPLNAQRAAGGKKLRYVGRVWPAGVTQDPPRSTIWLHMNLPLYSPMAPGGGRNPGYGPYGARRPLPDVAVELADTRPARRDGGGRVQQPGRQVVGLVACAGDGRDVLPLGLARQPRTGPAGVRVGLEEAHVDDRCVHVQPLEAAEGEHRPRVAVARASRAGRPSRWPGPWPSPRTATARVARSRRRP